MSDETYWNGEPCEARKVRLVVADSPGFPRFWARPLVGQERDAVEVIYGGQTFYLYDEAYEETDAEFEFRRWYLPDAERQVVPAGQGWAKVTYWHGSPRFGHRSLDPQPGSVKDRPDA